MMVTSKSAGLDASVIAVMADSMMAAAVWEEAGWGRFGEEDMVAALIG